MLVCGMSGTGRSRLATRDTNQFGKDPAELQRIRGDIREVEPLLRRVATHEIDTTRPLRDVDDELERIGRRQPHPSE